MWSLKYNQFIVRQLYMVSAWAQQNNRLLRQVKVDDKLNEITAIPKLLSQLELAGAVVTIDAMGCQKIALNKSNNKAAIMFSA